MKRIIQKIISELQYQVGAFLFFSGVARLHLRLHEFAMRSLQRSADAHHVKAQLLMGKLLKYRGATIYNQMSGVNYLRQSADKGSPEAQFMLAEALVNETLVVNDDYHDARAGLSAPISSGKVNQDNPVDLYLLAAKAGHPMAALRLSKIYKQGTLGIECNTVQAEFWLSEFMKHGKQG